jgi:hypothetical protein
LKRAKWNKTGTGHYRRFRVARVRTVCHASPAPRVGVRTPPRLRGGPRVPCELRRHVGRTPRPGEWTDRSCASRRAAPATRALPCASRRPASAPAGPARELKVRPVTTSLAPLLICKTSRVGGAQSAPPRLRPRRRRARCLVPPRWAPDAPTPPHTPKDIPRRPDLTRRATAPLVFGPRRTNRSSAATGHRRSSLRAFQPSEWNPRWAYTSPQPFPGQSQSSPHRNPATFTTGHAGDLIVICVFVLRTYMQELGTLL